MPTDHDLRERGERFTGIFETYHSQLTAYVSRRVPSSAVDDVVADVFAAAWRDLDQIDGDPLIWLYRIGRHTVSNQWRAAQRRARLTDRLRQNDRGVGGDYSEHVGWKEPFEAAFAALSEADREVLRLVAWEDLTRAEAAAVLGC
jgi:RNA polymerase sigma-70 factor, ECF subfamily